jgi:predicted lipid-binding transport protein (Tim44 family)
MKRFLLFLFIILGSLSILAADAEAKRFGGGASIGKQRAMTAPVAPKAPAAAPQPAATPQPAVPPQPAPTGNRWLGPLAGLAIGAGLGALFAGGGLGGMGGGILMALLAAGVVIFLISALRRPHVQPTQYAGAGAPYATQPPPQAAPVYTGGAPSADIPADFPVDAFIRSAKMSFIRLQAANDRKDLDDIREYTTPEMFAEISMQLQERGNAPQKTDVLNLEAALLEVAHEGDYAIASVRMSGQLAENGGAPENFDEIWHVQKNLHDDKSVWLLCGIQQIS